jgi:hypothetical protein
MVQTVDDAVPEDDEVFSVNVAAAGRLPRRVTVPANLRASGTIEDNDATCQVSLHFVKAPQARGVRRVDGIVERGVPDERSPPS